MLDLFIVHGCCKAQDPETSSRAKVEAENQRATAPLEGAYGELHTGYYTCVLAGEARRLGHEIGGEAYPLPEDCAAVAVEGGVDHDDFAAWLGRLEQGRALLTGGGSGEGEIDGEGWADAHTYLHPHAAGALGPDAPFRTPVWEAVAADTPARPYVVIGHSLGALVVADMVRLGVLQPAGIVTVGSPLAIPMVSETIERFTFDGPWLDLYDRRDATAAFGRLSPFDAGFFGSPGVHAEVASPTGGDPHQLDTYLAASATQVRPLLESGKLSN